MNERVVEIFQLENRRLILFAFCLQIMLLFCSRNTFFKGKMKNHLASQINTALLLFRNLNLSSLEDKDKDRISISVVAILNGKRKVLPPLVSRKCV